MSLRGYKPKWKKALWTKMRNAPKTVVEKRAKRCRRVSKSLSKRKIEYYRERNAWLLMLDNHLCKACLPIVMHKAKLGEISHPVFGPVKIPYWLMTPKAATECHHTHGRVGKLLLFKPWWIAVCSDCHKWIHSNPERARELGLLCAIGEWNTQPK